MAVGYETKTIQNSLELPDRDADLETCTKPIFTEKYHGKYLAEAWVGEDTEPDFYRLTELQPMEATAILDPVELNYVHAENLAYFVQNSRFSNFYRYLGYDAQQTNDLEGSFVEIKTPSLAELTQKSHELDGDDDTAPLVFEPYPGESYTTEEFLAALREGKVLMADSGWERMHDRMFHAAAWCMIPPQVRRQLFDRAGQVLDEYVELENSDWGTVDTAKEVSSINNLQSFISERSGVDGIINNLLLATALKQDPETAETMVRTLATSTQLELDAPTVVAQMYQRIESAG